MKKSTQQLYAIKVLNSRKSKFHYERGNSVFFFFCFILYVIIFAFLGKISLKYHNSAARTGYSGTSRPFVSAEALLFILAWRLLLYGSRVRPAGDHHALRQPALCALSFLPSVSFGVSECTESLL
jgi:hypothetical protein